MGLTTLEMGTVSNVTYVMSNFEYLAINTLINAMNMDVQGAVTYTYENICYTIDSTSTVDAGNTTMVDTQINSAGVYSVKPSGDIGDTYDDDSATGWSTSDSSISEGSGAISCSETTGGGSPPVAGSMTNDYNLFANTNYVEAKVILTSTGRDSFVVNTYIKITDGSSSYTLLTNTRPAWGANTVTDESVWRFYKNGDSLTVYDDGVELGSSPFDITGWSNVYINLAGDTAAATALTYTCSCYYLFETDSSWNYQHDAGVFQSGSMATITTSETVALLWIYNLIGSPALSVSFDAGSNFTSVTHKKFTTIADTGTSIRIKVSYSSGTFTYTDSNTNTLPRMYDFGLFYG